MLSFDYICFVRCSEADGKVGVWMALNWDEIDFKVWEAEEARDWKYIGMV